MNKSRWLYDSHNKAHIIENISFISVLSRFSSVAKSMGINCQWAAGGVYQLDVCSGE